MKIDKFNKVNENLENKDHYVIRQYTGGDYYEIPANEDYNQNYIEDDLEDVVRYLMEEEISGDFRIFKIVEEEVNNNEIDRITKDIELKNNTKKYNL